MKRSLIPALVAVLVGVYVYAVPPGTTDEIAALVAWMCSAECSYSTGAIFDLSGGRATY